MHKRPLSIVHWQVTGWKNIWDEQGSRAQKNIDDATQKPNYALAAIRQHFACAEYWKSAYRVSFNIIRSIHDCTHWRGGICVADRISNERDLFRPYGSRSEHKRGISPNNIARFLFPASRSVLFSRSNAECTNVNCHLPLNEHWRVGASARFIDVLSKPIASVERRWRVSFKKRNHTQQREAVQWWHSSLSLSPLWADTPFCQS